MGGLAPFTWSASIPPEDNWGRALIAGIIKDLRLATRVEDGAVCASACFLLFAAGEPRTAHPNSFIDVHKAADNDDRETYKSREATAQWWNLRGNSGCLVARAPWLGL